MKNMTTKAMLVAMTVVTANVVAGEQTPKGWFHAGSHPKDYEMSTDRKVAHAGESSALVKCIAAKPGGFGTLLQGFKADTYRGKRARSTSADVMKRNG